MFNKNERGPEEHHNLFQEAQSHSHLYKQIDGD